MKKTLAWLAAVMLLASSGLAQANTDFRLSCSHKTIEKTDILAPADLPTYTLVTAVEEGAYIRLTGVKDEASGLVECWYELDGKQHKGWIAGDALTTALVTSMWLTVRLSA